MGSGKQIWHLTCTAALQIDFYDCVMSCPAHGKTQNIIYFPPEWMDIDEFIIKLCYLLTYYVVTKQHSFHEMWFSVFTTMIFMTV